MAVGGEKGPGLTRTADTAVRSGGGLEIVPSGGCVDRAVSPLLGVGHLKIHLLQPAITLARLIIMGLLRQSGTTRCLFSEALCNDHSRNLDY